MKELFWATELAPDCAFHRLSSLQIGSNGNTTRSSKTSYEDAWTESSQELNRFPNSAQIGEKEKGFVPNVQRNASEVKLAWCLSHPAQACLKPGHLSHLRQIEHACAFQS